MEHPVASVRNPGTDPGEPSYSGVPSRLRNFLPAISGTLLFLAFLGLYYVDRESPYHLFFHTTAELFSIIVAAGIFMISWNSRRFSENSFLVFLGIAFLYIAAVDVLHTLTWRGMNLLNDDNANTPTQFWIAARFMQAASLLVAPYYLNRRLPAFRVHLAFGAATALLVLLILVFRVFPAAYYEGVGLTTFKKIGEYAIILMFAASFLVMYRLRGRMDARLRQYIAGSIAVAIVSEVMFTLYVNLNDIPMIIGHFLKVVSFYLLYRAIIVRSLWQPYGLLFSDLRDRNRELDDRKKMLEDAIEALTHPFYIIDAKNYEVVKANSAAKALADDDRCLTCHAMTHRRPKPCDSGDHACPLNLIRTTKKPALVEHVHFSADGKPRYYEVYGYPVLDGDGTVSQMIEYSLDVTERRRAQLELEATTKELERSNGELQQFAYIASHDLQEPLRMVSSYVHLLSQRYKGRLDEDADTFIRFAVDGADRMRDLINGLLSFSRVGTHAKPSVPLSTDAVVKKTLSNLEMLINESGAVIETGELPDVSGDETQIIQLFQNLIANSIKFRREEPVRVRIEGVRKGDMIEFGVEDNGIGIDEKYYTRIFQIFQRLHTREEYPGTGMGLTICKKIVERHGGTIRPVSTVGKGTVFYFTLPSA